MLVSLQNGVIKKFQRTPWRFQQTFRTPFRSLPSFCAAIPGSLDQPEFGAIFIDSVVKRSANLEALLFQHRLPNALRHDSSISAETNAELQSLLTAALGDWVDFLFVPSPKPFVLYADHDEYSTFFANSKSKLNLVRAALTGHGFTSVENYRRPLIRAFSRSAKVCARAGLRGQSC